MLNLWLSHCSEGGDMCVNDVFLLLLLRLNLISLSAFSFFFLPPKASLCRAWTIWNYIKRGPFLWRHLQAKSWSYLIIRNQEKQCCILFFIHPTVLAGKSRASLGASAATEFQPCLHLTWFDLPSTCVTNFDVILLLSRCCWVDGALFRTGLFYGDCFLGFFVNKCNI